VDNQSPLPNVPSGAERPAGIGPENASVEAPGVTPQEAAPSPSDRAGAGAPPPQPMPAPLQQSVPGSAAPVQAGASPAEPAVQGPALAGDVDVIEPEWVEKASNVVHQTQGDPYHEEEAIEDLQQDYLMKRYGYKVGDPPSGKSKPEGT
jgi:hypothetical protein